MMNDQNRQHGDFIEKFSLCEKIFLRIVFYGVIIIGAYGIYSESRVWGFLYLGFLLAGTIILLFSLCSHCPYPHKYSECLIISPWVMKKISKFNPEPMSSVKKTGSLIMLGGMIIIPQFWLGKNITLLVLFWLFCVPAFIIFPLYFCKRCRHVHCPYNMRKWIKTSW